MPPQEQITGLFEPGTEGPIYKVNLLTFKDNAEYKNGRPTKLTGREDVDRLMLGEVEEFRDEVVIATHPTRKAMLDMMPRPYMQEISTLSAAGLAGQFKRKTNAPKRASRDQT